MSSPSSLTVLDAPKKQIKNSLKTEKKIPIGSQKGVLRQITEHGDP